MDKKLYINGRFLLSPPTGVERYAYEMCKALVRQGLDITLVCPKQGRIQDAYDVSELHIIRYGLGRSHLWEQLVLPFFFLRRRNYLLLSFTGLGSILVPHKLMTIHDLSFLVNPRWFSRSYYNYYRLMTPLAVRTSKGIITVSQFSKSEILRFYPFLRPEQVHVVYSAPARDKFQSQAPDAVSAEEPYFLAVSSLDPRKNFSRLIEAFREGVDCRLKLVGGAGRVFAANHLEESVDNIQLLGRVSDEELARLYAGAEAFIFPSLYEGFGLPPLEAMLEGCPVLVSDIPIHHEVCADAALYFDPQSVQSIREAVNSFCRNRAELRPRLTSRGLKNAERFSWSGNAQELLNVIEQYQNL